MGRKRRDELDEPTKIDADFEEALGAMLNDEDEDGSKPDDE